MAVQHATAASRQEAEQSIPSPWQRLLRFSVAMGLLLLVMYVIAPFLVSHIAPFEQYARTVDETGIIPGALYYTDVPQASDAEANNRNAIRFMVKGGEKDR